TQGERALLGTCRHYAKNWAKPPGEVSLPTRPLGVDVLAISSQEWTEEDHKVVSPLRKRSAVQRRWRHHRRAELAPGRCRGGKGLAGRQLPYRPLCFPC